MGHVYDILKRAHRDPKIDLYCVTPELYKEIARILPKIPEDAIVSEWRYDIIKVHYEYHIHTDGIKEELLKLFKEGKRGWHPTLTAIYSREDLEKIVNESKL